MSTPEQPERDTRDEFLRVDEVPQDVEVVSGVAVNGVRSPVVRYTPRGYTE